jgi:hypothetical protein
MDFAALAKIAATQRRKEHKKLRRLRAIKRALHFVGFLSYWAIFAGVTWLLALAAMIVCVYLA